MKKVGVVFGGVACEHDVSIITGLQLIENIDKKKYEVIPIYIHSDGEWYFGDALKNPNIYDDFDAVKSTFDLSPFKTNCILNSNPLLLIIS